MQPPLRPIEELSEHVRAALAHGRPLRIRGGGSKDFYGEAPQGETLDTSGCRGIAAYEPTELFITARAGTPLAEVEALLAQHHQMLAFEPPHFGDASWGGMIAAGLSGPRRQAAGPLRDFVLGVRIVDGHGELLRFGGQVIKNVAGYDVSRLIAGSLGTLGLIVEATVKVLPRPACEQSLRFELDQATAIARLNHWAGQPLPISASCWHAGQLTLRLSGAEAAVRAAATRLGGERVDDAPAFWASIREQTHAFFEGDAPLWRLALPSTSAPLPFDNPLIEWGGGLRWLRGNIDPQALRRAAQELAGHATLFRAAPELKAAAGVFQELAPALWTLHQRMKQAFDPKGIFSPGRMYPGL